MLRNCWSRRSDGTASAARGAGTRAPAPAMSKVAPAHAMATQVQGEVVEVDEPDGINNQEGVDESDARTTT